MITRISGKLLVLKSPSQQMCHTSTVSLFLACKNRGKTTTDALTIANGFCAYFTNVVEKLLSSTPPLNWNQLSTEACLNNSSQCLFSLKPVSAPFVHCQLRSILGPILFSIYINDLPNGLFQSKILLYADDAVLFYADSNIGNISTALNKDLKQLQSWTHLNKLCIHPVKTECVLFGTQQRIASASLSDGPFSLFLGDKPINQAQHYKYLGVLIDANLNFKQHVDKLLVKNSKRIGVLGRSRNNLTVDAANKVYQFLVLPVMDYCDVA